MRDFVEKAWQIVNTSQTRVLMSSIILCAVGSFSFLEQMPEDETACYPPKSNCLDGVFEKEANEELSE